MIILYDENCGFCRKCRVFVQKRDVLKRFTFLDIKSQEAGRLIETLYIELNVEKPESIVLITANKEIFYKGTACSLILKELGGFWWFLGRSGLLLPRFFRDFLYDLVSVNRYLLCSFVNCKS